MCLYGCLDPLVADVIHAGLHVLYLPAVGTKGQIKHGLPVGDFLSLGSKEYLRAALLGVAGDICQTFTVQFMQVYKEGTEYGILLCISPKTKCNPFSKRFVQFSLLLAQNEM